jgi:ferric-dicitrate binding protein FerR (iron transport regulator)
MSASSDIELEAAEWLVQMEGSFDDSVWADFQRWLAENPDNRRVYVELVQAWKGTEVLRTVARGRDSAREMVIPELLSENSDLRGKLHARSHKAVVAAARVDVAHVVPRHPSVPLHRLIKSIADLAKLKDIGITATPLPSKAGSPLVSVSPLPPAKLTGKRRK